jgi:hypothetical protein
MPDMKFNRLGTWVIALILTSLAGGCNYDNEETLYPGKVDCVLDSVTYSGSVLPILEDNCYSCHKATNNQGGGVVLEGYAQFSVWVSNGSVLNTVETGKMPKNGNLLLECESEKIRKWIAEGAQNN